LEVERSHSQLPLVSVVVSFHNEGAVLKRCVSSLLKQTYPLDRYEIVLVNDGSNDMSEDDVAEFIRASPVQVKILRQADRGPAAGRNLGVTNASGSIVAFTDPDCVAHSDWLTKHVRNYVSDQVGGVEGKVETDWDQLMEPIRISPAGYRYVTCNMSYRREVLQKVGLFDETFRWKEDDDLAYRVIDFGLDLVSDDRAVVYHPVKKLNAKGLIRFGLKHRYDVLFYSKHLKIGKGYFRTVYAGRITLTREFFLTCGAVLVFVIAVGGLLTRNVFVVPVLVAVGLWAAMHRRGMLRRKVKSSILWMGVYIVFIELGRLWGTLKFRKFFL
jgi:glycosyltransferase involved in cell wall biosynthesis